MFFATKFRNHEVEFFLAMRNLRPSFETNICSAGFAVTKVWKILYSLDIERPICTFDIEAEPCLTETRGNFRTFVVDESFGPSNKVVYLKKLVFQSGICFLIRCIFGHAQRPLVDF